MDWLALLLPVAIGALTSLAVAFITTRTQLRKHRDEIEAKVRAEANAWRKEFAEAAVRGREHTRVLAQQFRVGYLAVIQEEGASAERHFIPKDATITLGRDAKSDIVISSSDGLVSRTHGLIEANDEGVFFLDVSTNATSVNGARVGPAKRKLSSGDVLEIGSTRATFHALD